MTHLQFETIKLCSIYKETIIFYFLLLFPWLAGYFWFILVSSFLVVRWIAASFWRWLWLFLLLHGQ